MSHGTKWNVSDDEYFNDELHESNSRLKVFRESVPKYHAMFIEKSMAGKETKLMDFGKAFHLALLQPEQYKSNVVVGPDLNKNSNAWKAWKAEHQNFIILDVEESSRIQRMLASVHRHTRAKQLLGETGDAEMAIRWYHDKTETWCKAKLDYLIHQPKILDVKTCTDANPVEFSRSCGMFSYESQAAFYIDGVYELTGVRPDFIHIAVGAHPPHECHTYKLDKEAIDLGRAINEETLVRLRDCRDSGVWKSQYGDDILELSLPRWAFNRVPVSG